jgi:hypothetical protein
MFKLHLQHLFTHVHTSHPHSRLHIHIAQLKLSSSRTLVDATISISATLSRQKGSFYFNLTTERDPSIFISIFDICLRNRTSMRQIIDLDGSEVVQGSDNQRTSSRQSRARTGQLQQGSDNPQDAGKGSDNPGSDNPGSDNPQAARQGSDNPGADTRAHPGKGQTTRRKPEQGKTTLGQTTRELPDTGQGP